ncbi:MAG: hypothetical protein U0L26_01890, partial [Cellulosilyticum sp.]|nr:hypothetical protein [Cellulosilyticum sp.]
MDNKKVMDIDLTTNLKEFEMASYYDADLMRIKAFATTEGKNLNGTIFPRQNLLLAYRSFIDKPVIIVPALDNSPTGHGFDFKNGTFDTNKRKHVGHITHAHPVIVTSEGEVFTIYDVEDAQNYPEGELRIVVEIAIYKHYFTDIAQRLEFLHSIGELAFSMEALVSAISTEDGGKVCTDITFTGLAIVDSPAFVNSKSIEVSEKEEEDMELQEKYEALVAEKAVVDSELQEVKDEVTSLKEELAEVKGELANVKAEKESVIAELTPFKEQVEAEQKAALGASRAEKLAKLNVEKDATELAELTKEEFADMLVEAAENYQPVVASKEVEGIPQEKIGIAKNDGETLKS